MSSSLIYKAKKFLSEGKINDAEQCFLAALQKDKQNKEIYNNLGRIAFLRNNIELSINYFIQSLKIDPYYRDSLLNCFEVLKFSTRYHLFLPYFHTYLEKFPDDENVKILHEEARQHIQIKSQDPLSVFECERDVRHIPLPYYLKVKAGQKLLIQKIDNLIKSLNQEGYHINKPHRNIILTEIPGSGLTVFSNIINCLQNIVYLNNIVNDIEMLPQSFVHFRKKIIKDFNDKKLYQNRGINEDVVIAIQQNLAYLKLNEMQGLRHRELETLLNYGYRIIAIVRDPVETIEYWNKPESSHLPESMVTDDNLSPRWKGINFASNDKIERQAQIWQFYASVLLSFSKIIKIYTYTYEQITMNLGDVLQEFCQLLPIPFPKNLLNNERPEVSKSFPTNEKIQKAVEKFCILKTEFGYGHSGLMDFLSSKVPEEKEMESHRYVNFQECLDQWHATHTITIQD